MKYWIIGLALILLAGIGFYFATGDETDQTSTAATSETTGSSEVAEASSAAKTTGGLYVDYKPELIAENVDKSVIVYFHADWCPNCRALDKTLTAGAIPEDIVILKADYDTEAALKQKYGVTQQTTMVQVDKDGNKLKLWIANAFDDIEDIQSQLL